MAMKTNFLNLPAELRERIFYEYFRVDGGYVYDADSDCLKTAVGNHSIDLALLFTCRTVVNEARHLPLSLNTIKFTTLYRRDTNNLAGCFNFVSGLYDHVKADLVVLLAKFLTPEMRSELTLECPRFGPSLARAASERDDIIENQPHDEEVVRSMDRTYKGNSAAGAAKMRLKNRLDDTGCIWAESFIYSNHDEPTTGYSAFSTIGRRTPVNHHDFSCSLSRAANCWSRALELLVQQEPSEFSNQIYKIFPEWVNRHSAQEFLGMSLEHWAIPSEAHVKRSIELLALEGMWDLPDMWHDARLPWYRQAAADPDTSTPSVRCQEKIRFSAVANAIRFLETRIGPEQRLDIRTLLLHEDLPSVNVPSSHAQGLAPFFRENPLLRVERRVDLMRCMVGALDRPSIVAARFQQLDDLPEEEEIRPSQFRPELSQWLVDALAVTSVGIPASSFTLIIEAGPYRDWISDLFQQRSHKEIAWYWAYQYLEGIKSFGARNVYHILTEEGMIQEDEVEAFEILMNKSSSILRTDFDTGVAWDVDTIVNDTQSLNMSAWFDTWWRTLDLSSMEQPTHQVDYKVRLADNYEIQIN